MFHPLQSCLSDPAAAEAVKKWVGMSTEVEAGLERGGLTFPVMGIQECHPRKICENIGANLQYGAFWG